MTTRLVSLSRYPKLQRRPRDSVFLSVFAKVLCILGKFLVHELWWNSEATKHFHGKVPKIGMPSKDSSHNHQQARIEWSHDYQRTNAIRPGSIFEASFQSKYLTHRWSDKDHGRCARNGKDCTNQEHFSIPTWRVPWRYFLWRHPSL